MKKAFNIALVAGATMMASSAYAACGKVTMTEMNWASSAVVTGVAKFIMEQGYGCEVKTVPSSTIPAVTSVSETGEPDIVSEIWVNSVPLYTKLESAGKIKTASHVLSDGGIEGWWIPKYLADKHPELKTIEGILKNPQLVGGEFHNCPVGWGCRVINDNLISAWDFAGKNMRVFNHGSGETLAASIASSYADKKAWFGYYWAPTSVLGKYPMVKVDIGPHIDKLHKCNTKDSCADPGRSAYPSSKVLTGVTTDFASREPDVFKLLEKLSFTNDVMGKVLSWQEDNKASPEEAAVHFLTTYKDVWNSWLNDEARGKLSKVL